MGTGKYRAEILAVVLVTMVSVGCSNPISSIDGTSGATMNNTSHITSAVPSNTAVTVAWSGGHNGGSMVATATPASGSPVSRAVTPSEQSSRSLTLSGLVANTSYSFKIVCSSSGYTSYGASTNFTTLP